MTGESEDQFASGAIEDELFDKFHARECLGKLRPAYTLDARLLHASNAFQFIPEAESEVDDTPYANI